MYIQHLYRYKMGGSDGKKGKKDEILTEKFYKTYRKNKNEINKKTNKLRVRARTRASIRKRQNE